ncbi:MAG TPA: cysteine hydrolase [Candidatus Scybalocola faecavium]|nr:cysteine hydrolase [Candidatus Scybalocola faecavium]
MSRMLVVVDMQNDFIDGALGTAEAKAIVPKVIRKIRDFKGQIFYTRDTHDENYLETQEGKNLPVKHCIMDTHGWQLQEEIGELAKERRSMIFDKPAFGSLALAGCLNGIQKVASIDEIELVGLCTDICVISNALLLKAALPDTKIIVDSSCCAGVTPESHENALKAMAMCQVEIR